MLRGSIALSTSRTPTKMDPRTTPVTISIESCAFSIPAIGHETSSKLILCRLTEQNAWALLRSGRLRSATSQASKSATSGRVPSIATINFVNVHYPVRLRS